MTIPCRKGTLGLALVSALLIGLAAPSARAGVQKRLRVSTDYARLHLQADASSSVVDTLGRGTVLSLLYGGKMKRSWYYVSFKSEKTDITKSGYVLDSEVELLFDPLLTITIQEERPGMKVEYPPRHFEEMNWGISKKQVVETEGKPTYQGKDQGGDFLIYGQKVINLDCDVEYRFAANRLRQTRFSFGEETRDGDACLEDYRKVKDALIRKFGKPDEESMDWRDPAYKEDFSSWPTAVGLGQLEMSSRWLTSRTEIVASLSGDNGETALEILFTGLRLPELARKNQGLLD